MTPAEPLADTLATLVFAGYLLALMGVGLWAARRAGGDLDEYFLGGRRLGPWIVALSAVVSGRSSWLILGVSGTAFSVGVQAVWVLPGYILAELFMFVVVAPRLRRFTGEHDCLTLPDFFVARFGDPGGWLRRVSAGMILVFFTAYTGAQLTAGTKTFQAVFGLSAVTGAALVTVIVALYTVTGGFMAVSVTDGIQAVLMLGGLVVMPGVVVARQGGLEALLVDLGGLGEPSGGLLAAGALAAVVKGLAIGTGSFGQPHVLARYMACADPDQLRVSAVVGTVWNVLMGWGAVMVGLAGRSMYREASALPLGDPETLFVAMAHDVLPAALFGLLVAAVVAAIQSTVDSQLLVAASAATRDLYQRGTSGGAEAEGGDLVRVGRVTVLVILAVAFGLGVTAATSDNQAFKSVFRFVLQAWYGLGCAFGPLVLLALLWPGANRHGALAGMLVGPACVLAGLVSRGYADWIGAAAQWARPELVGFFGSAAAIVVVSLVVPARESG